MQAVFTWLWPDPDWNDTNVCMKTKQQAMTEWMHASKDDQTEKRLTEGCHTSAY